MKWSIWSNKIDSEITIRCHSLGTICHAFRRDDIHWGFSYCTYTTWLNKKGRFCDLLLCACPYASSRLFMQQLCLCLVGYSFERGSHSLFVLSKGKEHSTIKSLQTLLSSKVVSSIPCGVVQWNSATSYAFFTVSHQNGFISSIQSASNLHLVRITYLYEYSV
jgi:hypothetical protein